MDLHGFDLNLLVALDALLAEKNVTRAGRRIHLSQSAMSGVLARLRHALNDKLLVPSRGGMTLTPLAGYKPFARLAARRMLVARIPTL